MTLRGNSHRYVRRSTMIGACVTASILTFGTGYVSCMMYPNHPQQITEFLNPSSYAEELEKQRAEQIAYHGTRCLTRSKMQAAGFSDKEIGERMTGVLYGGLYENESCLYLAESTSAVLGGGQVDYDVCLELPFQMACSVTFDGMGFDDIDALPLDNVTIVNN